MAGEGQWMGGERPRSRQTGGGATHRVVDVVVRLGDYRPLDEQAQRLRRDAAAAKSANGGHARVVPPTHVLLLHELDELALGDHAVLEVEPRELDLPWPGGEMISQLVEDPVIERPVVLELCSQGDVHTGRRPAAVSRSSAVGFRHGQEEGDTGGIGTTQSS